MKKIAFILVMIFVYLISNAQDTINTFDVRNVRWGMTKEEVKLNEKGIFKYNLDKNTMSFSDKILTYNCGILYTFINNKLVKVSILFEIYNIENNLYVNDYNLIKKTVLNKYGKPAIDKIDWTNDMFENEPSNIGLALSLQQVNYYAVWTLKRNDILLLMRGDDDGKIKISLLYASQQYKDQIEKNNENDNL